MGKKILAGLKWFLNSYIWIFPLFFATDIITKNVIVANLAEGESVTLIPGFLKLTYSVNPAAAFSIGTGNPLANKIIYGCIAGLASIAIIFFYIKKYKTLNGLVKACLMLVLVGALGNLFDRLFYTQSYLHCVGDPGVVDFIDFYTIWNAIFNIADCCVVIAAIMLIIYFIVEEVKDFKARKANEPKVEVAKSKTEQMMEKKDDSTPNEEK